MKQTMAEAGYRFIDYLGKGNGAIFLDIDTGNKEVWVANKGHASYGFNFRGTDWEFTRSYKGY